MPKDAPLPPQDKETFMSALRQVVRPVVVPTKPRTSAGNRSDENNEKQTRPHKPAST